MASGDDDLIDEEEDNGVEDLDDRYLKLVMRDERGGPEPRRWTPGAEHGLPPTVVVDGDEYRVRAFFPDDDGDWSRDLLGLCDPAARLIWVQVGRSLAGQRETLLHEVLHAIDVKTGAEAGEELVEWMAPILLDVLRRNRDLVTLFLNSEEPSREARPR